MSGYGKVAVIMGGQAAEREISLRSGAAVLAALQRQGIDAEALDMDRAGLQALLESGFDRALVMVHGRGGEDGVLQGALETLGIPYTGSGVLGSALCMDKLRSKRQWQAAGMATPDFVAVQAEDIERGPDAMPLPCIVKPVHEGSSIGMTKVTQRDQLAAALTEAARYDREILVERWIDGVEYTAGIVGERLLPLIRLETPREFYDYRAKYQADDTRYVCPCGLAETVERQLQAQSRAAFDCLGAQGWGRVDFMLDHQGQAWFIEVNTVPGMTDHSLVPMAAAAAGMDFDALVLAILDTSCPLPGRASPEVGVHG